MSSEEKDGVRRMVIETVARLQKSSTSAAHVGSRYARLISLLWKRPPKQNSDGVGKTQRGETIDGTNTGQPEQPVMGNTVGGGMPLNTFSWLDLDSVGTFAAQNTANPFSPGFTDFNYVPEDLNAVTGPGIDSQQWFNDTGPNYVF